MTLARAWITEREDGRRGYKFHQSWLADTDLCLERARLGLLDDMWDPPSDATAVGTAMHYGAEIALGCRMNGEIAHLADIVAVAQAEFSKLIALDGFVWKKRKERGARTYLERAVTNWFEHVFPKLDPLAVELSFGPDVVYEDDERVIELGGTIDYVDRRPSWGLADWKTGSPHSWEGKDWEKSRWAIQPTVYTWAWDQYSREHGLELPPIPQPFTFIAMLDNGAIQKVRVERRPEDWAWLERKVLGVVRQIERGTDGPWPMNDTHALCSARWCGAWAGCKGALVHDAWPK
jgi:hypothetical protein